MLLRIGKIGRNFFPARSGQIGGLFGQAVQRKQRANALAVILLVRCQFFRRQFFQVTIRIGRRAFQCRRRHRMVAGQMHGKLSGERNIARFQRQAQPLPDIRFADDAGGQRRLEQRAATVRLPLAAEPQPARFV